MPLLRQVGVTSKVAALATLGPGVLTRFRHLTVAVTGAGTATNMSSLNGAGCLYLIKACQGRKADFLQVFKFAVLSSRRQFTGRYPHTLLPP